MTQSLETSLVIPFFDKYPKTLKVTSCKKKGCIERTYEFFSKHRLNADEPVFGLTTKVNAIDELVVTNYFSDETWHPVQRNAKEIHCAIAQIALEEINHRQLRKKFTFEQTTEKLQNYLDDRFEIKKIHYYGNSGLEVFPPDDNSKKEELKNNPILTPEFHNQVAYVETRIDEVEETETPTPPVPQPQSQTQPQNIETNWFKRTFSYLTDFLTNFFNSIFHFLGLKKEAI